MGRAWRKEFNGAFSHVLSRGNERWDIFFDDYDRRQFLESVKEMSNQGLTTISNFKLALKEADYA
jgi:hypothetical protein